MKILNSLLPLALLTSLTAQDAPSTASSSNHFLASFEFGAGGRATSPVHILDASSGEGMVAGRAVSNQHVLTGGFNASLEVQATGKPWISAVTPRFTALRSGATVTLVGTELNLSTTVTIGGQAATVQSRVRDRITVTLPDQPVPGWQPVTVHSAAGSHSLTEGIGILPLLDTEPAPASDVPFSLVFRGNQGDTVVWALGLAPITPIPIGGFGYGFGLNPSLMMIVPGFGIANADGVFRRNLPATTYPAGLIYAQALFAGNHPGYAPGAFSNILRL